MKKARTYLLRILTVLIGAALVVFVAAQTTWVRSWVKAQIEAAVSEGTNGTLSIESLSGVLLGNVTLEGVVLRVEEDTLANLGRLDVEFSVLGLLSQSAVVDELTIDGLDVRLERSVDGSWNVDRVALSEDSSQNAEEPKAPFPWTIRVNHLRISDGSVIVQTRDSSGAHTMTVSGFLLVGSMTYSEEHTEGRIDSLSFTMHNPDLVLRHFAAHAQVERGALIVSDAEIATQANALSLSGQLGLEEGVPSRLTVSSGPLDFSEIPGLPPALNREIHPVLTGSAELLDDDVTGRILLTRDGEQLRCEGTVRNVSTEFTTSLKMELDRFDLGSWFPARFPASSLTGVVQIESSGIDLEQMDADLTVALKRSEAFGRSMESLTASASIHAFTVRGEIGTEGPFGSVHASVVIQDIRTMSGYDAYFSADHLDLSVLTENEELRSNLWLEGGLTGSGVDLSTASAALDIRVHGSMRDTLDIDTLQASAELADGNVYVRQLHIVHAAFGADVAGEFGFDETVLVAGTVRVLDAAPILALAGINAEVAGAGDLEIDVHGRVDSLEGKVGYVLSQVRYESFHADTLAGTVTASLVGKRVVVSGDVAGFKLLAEGVSAESVNAIAQYRDGMLVLSSAVDFGQGLTLAVDGRGWPGDTTLVEISKLAIEVGDDAWATGPDSVRLAIAGTKLELEGLVLESKSQVIMLGGVFDSEDSVDLWVIMDSTEIGSLSSYAGLPVKVGGTVTMDLRLRGSAAHPFINADLEAWNVSFDGQLVGGVVVDATARDSGIVWDLTLTDRFGNTVGSYGRLPYVAGIKGVSVLKDSSLSVHFETQGYDLRWISSLRDDISQVAGTLGARLDLTGTFSRPSISGMIDVRGGALFLPAIGLDIRDLVLNAGADGSRVRLDSLRARVGGGTITASGTAMLPLTESVPGSDSVSFVLKANQVSVDAPRRYEVQANSEIAAVFVNDQLEYSGSIAVPQARIYLPSVFTTLSATRRSTDRPLLVQATVPFDSVAAFRADSARRERRGAPVIGKHTRGKVDLSIPGNTWIQSPNINVELYGDLTATQTDTLLELEGTLTISRGTVQILGKRFLVRRGNAKFSRGPSVNPLITLELEYRFRDANRQDRYLTARLTGKADSPNITFVLDEKPVTQQDAISYLIFGRSVDELTLNQQSSVSGGDDNVAGAMAFDMLGAQLSNMIAQRVGLDVVEIKSTDGTKAGTLTAGKYIAEGVFVSYEKGFGEYGVNETIPEVFTIEYELIRSMFVQFVQANDRRSGADLIFKLE